MWPQRISRAAMACSRPVAGARGRRRPRADRSRARVRRARRAWNGRRLGLVRGPEGAKLERRRRGRLLGRLYRPDIAILPIGDYFTMGPLEAAEAIRLLGVKRVIPIHLPADNRKLGMAELLKAIGRS